jgi:hypothetical protein
MDRIENMARAMAIADGFDPDAQASGGPNDFALQASQFNGYGVCAYGPVWQTYRRKANLMIAALEASHP